MKAMVLAAGLGTRLRPLTEDRPKALVEINGRTLLEITLRRLKDFGINDVIINVHHFADMVVAYLKSRNNFGMAIEISREDILLDTGGGLKKAAPFFLSGSAVDEPFVLHNVDVISTIDLGRMVAFHNSRHALSTLAVQERRTSRYLIFDEELQLCGRFTKADNRREMVRSVEVAQELAFCGIHVISTRLLPMIEEDGIFSIIQTYLRLGAHQRILGFRADDYYWCDLGKPANIKQASEDLKQRPELQGF